MSWLSIQLPNPFKSLNFSDDDDDNQQPQPDDDDDEEEEFNQNASQLSEIDAGGGGVKDDLTAIGDSISRRFRGVAAFLAPPSTAESSSSSAVEGIRSDLAEIGGSFKSTLSLFSNPNKAVSEISRFASDFLQLNEENSENFDDRVKNDDDNDDDDDDDDGDEEEDDDDDEEYDAGVSDEVIEFARQISDRSELWIDFPLPLDHLVFDMSEAQSEHASIVEQLVPSLADLKNKISSDKSEQQFWMIYFILLLPRLNDDDLELLSTPQIVEARETLLMMLREKKNEESNSENPQSYSSSASDNKVDAEPENISSVRDVTTIENPNSLSKESNESVTVEENAGVQDTHSATSTQCDPVNAKADDLKLSKDPSSEAKAHENLKGFQTEDDVSFSDLEEEDDDSDLRNREPSSASSQIKRNSSTEGSTDWVRLHEGTRESHVKGQSGSRERDSEGEESTDWLTVDDFDP